LIALGTGGAGSDHVRHYQDIIDVKFLDFELTYCQLLSPAHDETLLWNCIGAHLMMCPPFVEAAAPASQPRVRGY
jgi:hypothetical protein